MKKSIIGIIIILSITLFSCGKSDSKRYEEMYEKFVNISDYCSTISVKTGNSEYTARQYFLSPNLYKMEFTSKGMEKTVCVQNGDDLCFKYGDEDTVRIENYVPDEKYFVFITDFMEEYVKSEESKCYRTGSETVLETNLNKANNSKMKMKLYISNKDNAPKRLETYNEKDEKVFEVRFSRFKMNTGIDKKIFEI